MTMTSFTAIGTPASGPSSSPACNCRSTRAAASRARSRLMVISAFVLGFSASAKRRDSCAISVALKVLARKPVRICSMVSVGMFIAVNVRLRVGS